MGKEKEDASKTYRLRTTDHVYQNIDDITNYIAIKKREPQSAIDVANRLIKAIKKIPLNPYGHRECEEIPTKRKMYRKALCMSWWIVYRIKNDEIVVLGVVSCSCYKSKIRSLRKIK